MDPNNQQPVPPTPNVPVSPIPQPTMQPTMQPVAPGSTQNDPGHGLGIASLVTSLLGIWPLGLILGFVARSQSKSVGKSNGLALAGIIISSISAVLFVLWVVLFIVLGIFGSKLDSAAISSLSQTECVGSSCANSSSIEGKSNTSQASSIEEASTSGSGKCLVETDFQSYEITGVYGDYNASVVNFNPDLTTYATSPFNEDGKSFVAQTLEKYKKLQDKDFAILLTGGVNKANNTEAGKKLAQDRAQKVMDELVAAGIPEGRFAIGDIVDSTNNVFDGVPEWNRSVTIDFTLNCLK